MDDEQDPDDAREARIFDEIVIDSQERELGVLAEDLATTVEEGTEAAWRKAIADQVRRNCTPSSEAYTKGGHILIYAVADWIENPPEWSHFLPPDGTV